VVELAVIGAGERGRRLAQRAAAAGLSVVLEDLFPSNRRVAEAELAGTGVRLASTIEEAVREAALVVDFVPDELESKLEIFCLLDRMAPPQTILCTPSVRMSITDLASCTYRAEQCVAVRDAEGGMNVGEAQSVHVLRGARTSDATVEAVTALWKRLGMGVSVELDPKSRMF
jgi:3-hydroxybutyryl-CoA dehydrogenase